MNVKTHQADYVLIGVVIALMGIGLIMVYSASSLNSVAMKADGLYYFKRQLMWVCIGLLGMLFFSKIPYGKLEKITLPMLISSIILLILVLIPGVARDIGGAKRWIRFGSFGFQPSEFAKFCIVMYMAHSISSRQSHIQDFLTGMLPDMFIAGLVALLIYKEPNLSTAILISGTYLTMYFLGNGSMKHLSAIGALGGITAVSLIFTAGYRIKRLTAFLNPWENAHGSGYHIIQSLIAIGSGGIFGFGLGQSRQKFFILPERHTDFIFAIICEELGLVGGLLVLALFTLLIWRGLYIATRAPDMFGFLLASGITTVIGLQVMVNIGVVLSLIPTTGVTLPFVSYGGSSLVFLAMSVGILLNISTYSNQKYIYEDHSSSSLLVNFNNNLSISRKNK